jgi:hypothetical protein
VIEVRMAYHRFSRALVAHGSLKVGLGLFVLLGLAVLGTVIRSPASRAQGFEWSTPINISNTPNSSWFPDLAVDHYGNVHVVWCETTHVEGRGESEQVFYTRWDGEEWLPPNDIVAPQFFIHRNAIAVGPAGDLFMVFRKAVTGGYGLFFMSAPVLDAWSAAAWSPQRLVGLGLHNYMADMTVDRWGVIHVVLDDVGEQSDVLCPGGCADIYYRHSTDNGQTWSKPFNLSASIVGSSREQVKVDPTGVIHAVWDEGWDRLSGIGDPLYSVYRSSFDGGLTWGEPVTITYPTTGTAQLTVGADGRGGVMLVWRNTERDEIFYQWSADRGETWSDPWVIPGVFARPWTIPFDLYDMATDSAGHIHLLVVGRQSLDSDAPLGVYHLVWNGSTWSYPVRVHAGPGLPEYPRLVISQGNHLHAAWFVRDDLWRGSNYEVWYSQTYSAAPQETPVPLPTPTLTPLPSPTPLLPPTPTAYPTLPPGTGGPPPGLRTESDEVLRVAMAVAPVLLVVLAIAIFRRMIRWP